MTTYPYATPDGIIELVHKDEHDAVVRELNERLTKQQADMLDTIIELRTQLAAIKTAAANAGFSEWLRKTLAAYESAKSDMLDTIVQLRAELTNTHSILDGDESKIIRNAKDGYPEGREARVLTLAERVKSLCIYAADWKRWTEEKEVELTRWQSLAESLATALDNLSHDCHNHAKDIIQIRWGYDGDCGSKLSAEQIEECCDAAKPALAAYESAKSDPLPDPLAEAVKRMEEVTDGAIEAAYWESGSWTRNIRALLISAAKGEQP